MAVVFFDGFIEIEIVSKLNIFGKGFEIVSKLNILEKVLKLHGN